MINPTVSFVRVASMMLILITHFLSWKNVNSFQISTIGVSSFLFISGYLYGTKTFASRIGWFLQRIKRVLLPFWILSAFLSIYLLTQREFLFAFQNFAETLFNLQGIHFIVHYPFKLGNYHISGLSHCWFLTVIMACYLLVLVIKNSKVERFIDKHVICGLFSLIFIHLSLAVLNLSVGTILIFFIGYFFKRLEKEKKILHSKFLIFIILISVFLFAIRVVFRSYADGTPVYDYFFASITSNAISVCFFLIIYHICQLMSSVSNVIASSSLWSGIDKMTYPIYLTHYMFLKGPFVIPFSQNIVLQLVYFFAMSVISASLLNLIVHYFFKFQNDVPKVK